MLKLRLLRAQSQTKSLIHLILTWWIIKRVVTETKTHAWYLLMYGHGAWIRLSCVKFKTLFAVDVLLWVCVCVCLKCKYALIWYCVAGVVRVGFGGHICLFIWLRIICIHLQHTPLPAKHFNFWAELEKITLWIRPAVSLTHQADELTSPISQSSIQGRVHTHTHTHNALICVDAVCVCVGCRSLLSNLSCGCRAHLWNELKLTSMPCIALNNIQQNYGNLPGNLNMIEMPTANYDKNLHDRVAITAQDVFISTFRKPFGMQTLGSIFCVHIRIYAALCIIYSLNGDWTSLLPKCQNSFSICLSAILKFREIRNELQTFRVYYHSCSSSYRDSADSDRKIVKKFWFNGWTHYRLCLAWRCPHWATPMIHSFSR